MRYRGVLVMKPPAEVIPQVMRDMHKWGYARPDKLPCDSSGKTIAHPLFNSSFDEIDKSTRYYVGFSLGGKYRNPDGTETDTGNSTGLLCLDYDKVIIDGSFVSDEIRQDIEHFKTVGYVERSLSNTGYHVFCDIPPWFTHRRKFPGDKQPEIMAGNQYILVTGKAEGKPELVPADDVVLERILKTLLESLESESRNGCTTRNSTPAAVPTTAAAEEIEIDYRKIKTITKTCETNIDTWNSTDDSRASETAQSICNQIVIIARGKINAEELNAVFRKSGFFQNVYKSGKHEWNESKAQLTYGKAIAGYQPPQKPKKEQKQKPAPAAYDGEYDFLTQIGISEYVTKNLKDDILYDADSNNWFIRDLDGYCFQSTKDYGAGVVKKQIEAELAKIADTAPEYALKAKRFCNLKNITDAIRLSNRDLPGIPADIAYVFDGGKTLYIHQDGNGKFVSEVRDNPRGLKSTFRIHGTYQDCTRQDIPADMKAWLDGYGEPAFTDALIHIMARGLLCTPDKYGYQFTSALTNTGKSSLNTCFMGAWGDCCYTEIDATEITTKNQTGRKTSLIQGITKPFLVMREATGKIDECSYKTVIDTTATFSGNYCGKDRVSVPRRASIFLETNDAIRADVTSPYKERTRIVEFTKQFSENSTIENLVKSAEWQAAARGMMIHALPKIIEARNSGKTIVDIVNDICPRLNVESEKLIIRQDYKQMMISNVLTKCENPAECPIVYNSASPAATIWQYVRNMVIDSGREIREWGMVKDENKTPNSFELREFHKELRKMGYDVKRINTASRPYVVTNGKLNLNEEYL